MRKAKLKRKSGETCIELFINLDGKGKSVIKTPIKFLNHMLEAFSKHSTFDLKLNATGDVDIDQHHTIEDIGIMLGKSVSQSLGDKKGINRAGFFAFPMDDSLGIVSIDLSGRPYLVFKADFKRKTAGDLDTDCVKEFFSGFSMGAGCNIGILAPYGDNDHHKVEAIFKAFGKAVKMACSKDKKLKDYLPTTKGILDRLGK